MCGGTDKCSCYAQFTGADCSLRACPHALAWADTADGTNQAHYYAECANKGLCDRKTGECKCFDGYEGKGCRRATCPDYCSGHGTCEYIQELAGDFQDRRYGPGYKYQDISCTSKNDGDAGNNAADVQSCRVTGSFNGAGTEASPVFQASLSEFNMRNCGAGSNEWCLHTYRVLGGGVGCDLTLDGNAIGTSFTGAVYDSGSVDLPNLADNNILVVSAALYAHAVTGMAVVFAKGTTTNTVPTALTDGSTYYVYKHATANSLVVFGTIGDATATYADDATAVAAGLDIVTAADGTDFTFKATDPYGAAPSNDEQAITVALDYGDAAVATDSGYSLVVDASFYAAVVTGQKAVYTLSTGDVPDAFADGDEVFIYKHSTANTISVAVDHATAVGFANDAAAIAGSFDVTTSAGTIGTGTLAVSEYSISFTLAGGTKCSSLPVLAVSNTAQTSVNLPTVSLSAVWPNSAFGGLTTSNIVARSANTDVAHGYGYNLWDAEKSQGCKCDLGYDGADCAHRIPPHGDDPVTTVKSSPMKQVVQIGSPSQALSSNMQEREEFIMIYHDPYGGIWRTDGILATTDDTLAASRVEYALNLLPNEVMLDAKVVARTDNTAPLCTRMYDGLQHLAGHIDSRKGSLKDMKYATNYCETTYTLATDAYKMDFTVEFGDHPGQSGVQYLLEVDINKRGPGSFPVSAGITGAHAMYSVAEMNYNANLGNLSELAECSDRGLDNGEGECDCFEGFRGLACEHSEALV
jgi:hypothetical protein